MHIENRASVEHRTYALRRKAQETHVRRVQSKSIIVSPSELQTNFIVHLTYLPNEHCVLVVFDMLDIRRTPGPIFVESLRKSVKQRHPRLFHLDPFVMLS